MGGTVTVKSNSDGTLLSGHSWIEYTPDGGPTQTYGTWGNNPGGLGNGLHEGLELGFPSDSSRTARLTDEQERALMDLIKKYKDQGAGGWGYLSPCSTFAADAWAAGTGEKLTHRSMALSTPTTLKSSIESKNKASPAPPPPAARPKGSSQSIKNPVQSCSG